MAMEVIVGGSDLMWDVDHKALVCLKMVHFHCNALVSWINSSDMLALLSHNLKLHLSEAERYLQAQLQSGESQVDDLLVISPQENNDSFDQVKECALHT